MVSAMAAFAQKVKVDWDRATDFARYSTYKWTKIQSPWTPSPEIEKLIYSDVDIQLQAKGLRKVENGEPDLFVGYSITLGKPKKQTAPAPDAESSSWQTGIAWSAQNPVPRKGTLNVDIAEAKKSLLVWRGSVVADVGESVNDARWKISRGVSEAFARYPPPLK
jgi:hypothetical protein